MSLTEYLLAGIAILNALGLALGAYNVLANGEGDGPAPKAVADAVDRARVSRQAPPSTGTEG